MNKSGWSKNTYLCSLIQVQIKYKNMLHIQYTFILLVVWQKDMAVNETIIKRTALYWNLFINKCKPSEEKKRLFNHFGMGALSRRQKDTRKIILNFILQKFTFYTWQCKIMHFSCCSFYHGRVNWSARKKSNNSLSFFWTVHRNSVGRWL